MMAGIMHRLICLRALSLSLIGASIALLVGSPANAQARPPLDPGPQHKAGSVATSSVGTAGQLSENNPGLTEVQPMARLNTRISNRVQSRIRNRIDRFYDPEANATSPFKVAAEQARVNEGELSR